jgi:hypothetical protein
MVSRATGRRRLTNSILSTPPRALYISNRRLCSPVTYLEWFVASLLGLWAVDGKKHATDKNLELLSNIKKLGC